jgi:hypothetical protein
MTKQLSELWALDVDRFLLDTAKAVDVFVTIGSEQGVINPDEITQAQHSIQESGGSFDVLGYLEGQGVTPESMKHLCLAFAHSGAADELLYTDSQSFLDELKTNNAATVLLTYGKREWQTAKLFAAGLSEYKRIITPVKRKGELISTWHLEADRYVAATDAGELLVAQTVNLGDDKAESFVGLPADCRGYLLQRPGEKALKSQVGEVPANVAIVRSIAEILPLHRLGA